MNTIRIALLALATSVSACTSLPGAATNPAVALTQQGECERSAGVWRAAHDRCESMSQH